MSWRRSRGEHCDHFTRLLSILVLEAEQKRRPVALLLSVRERDEIRAAEFEKKKAKLLSGL